MNIKLAVKNIHKIKDDLFDFILWDYFTNKSIEPYNIVREDYYVDDSAFNKPDKYFDSYKCFTDLEESCLHFAKKGRMLDVGCGAGRHLLYFKRLGFDVFGVDTSRWCVRICRKRGLNNTFQESIFEPKKILKHKFDTISVFGNNLGIARDLEGLKKLLETLMKIIVADGVVIGREVEYTNTTMKIHKDYQRHQKENGKYAGITTYHYQYTDLIGEWIDWLHVDSKTLIKFAKMTGWKSCQIIFDKEKKNYFFVLKIK
jgi:2-polyprenyl-3-methyl-5-hydroxy-6-metoxy-1,4-benzoquinol methylase